MDFEPEVGLLIRHMYLWRDEAKLGREEGRKARPCLIVHIRQNEYQEREVYIMPVTHTEPSDIAEAIEIPLATKIRLKLDDDRSWLIVSEVNRFIWVGPDLRKTQSNEFTYGFLPSNLVSNAIKQLKLRARNRSLSIVDRDDMDLVEKVRTRQSSKGPKGK